METMTFIAQGLRSYDNPATRIPVCVCMDISGSMNEKIGGSDRTSLDELKDGVQKFLADIMSDEQARYAAEICFITLISCAASLSVSTAVGSSNTSSFTPLLSISRAISTNCM